jgi:hypothetical protein
LVKYKLNNKEKGDDLGCPFFFIFVAMEIFICIGIYMLAAWAWIFYEMYNAPKEKEEK